MSLKAITADFARSMNDAIATIETNTAKAIGQIQTELQAAERRRADGLRAVQERQKEAAEMVADSMREQERIEAEFATALGHIGRALAEVKPDIRPALISGGAT